MKVSALQLPAPSPLLARSQTVSDKCALISARTKAVLAAKKAQGVKLGNPHFAETIGRAHAASRAIADQFAANVLTVIREIQKSGISTLRDIAAALNARGVRTARWSMGPVDGVGRITPRDRRD